MSSLYEFVPMFLQGLRDTLYMTLASSLFSYALGLPIGVLVTISRRDSIAPNQLVNTVLGWIVNIGRSVPFVILMVALIPVTKFIVGRSIGSTAAIVPLVVAATPFVARLVETSLAELDPGILEAALSMGASTWQIITKVMLPECVPSLIRGISITTITLIGYSAMAGTVGGGGLGDIAIRYGYHRYQYNVMLITVVLLIVIVAVIQFVFNLLASIIDKRNK